MATASAHLQSLPTQADRPDGEVLIFDGHCRFCLAQMRMLARLDLTKRLAFVSLHDDEVERQWPDLTHDQLMRQMYLIDRTGRRHAGAKAFRYLTRILPPLWPLAPLMHFPGSSPLWQMLYGIVAKYRYKFGRLEDECEDGACSVHFR